MCNLCSVGVDLNNAFLPVVGSARKKNERKIGNWRKRAVVG